MNFHTNQLILPFYFPGCWNSSMFPVFKNVGDKSVANENWPVNIFAVFSKILEKLVVKRPVHQLGKYDLVPGLFNQL